MGINRFTFLTALFLGCLATSVNINTNEIPLNTENDPMRIDEKDNPRLPEDSPVYCEVGDDYITFYCRYQAVGEVAITDADGIVIAYGVAELSTGYTLMLPDNLLPGMTLSVTIDGITYSAII